MGMFDKDQGVNPVERYLEYKASKKVFYDRKNDQEFPAKDAVFVVLKTGAKLSGGTGKGKDYKPHSSNVFFDTRTDQVSVFADKRPVISGLYQDIKEEAKAKYGCEYHVVVFAWFNEQVVQINLKGSGRSAWMDRKDNNDLVTVTELTEESGAMGDYFVPTFTGEPVKYEDHIPAEIRDTLQSYFEGLENRANAKQPDPTPDKLKDIWFGDSEPAPTPPIEAYDDEPQQKEINVPF